MIITKYYDKLLALYREAVANNDSTGSVWLREVVIAAMNDCQLNLFDAGDVALAANDWEGRVVEVYLAWAQDTGRWGLVR